MLDGITILNKEVIMTEIMPNETLFKLAGIIFIISLIIALATLTSDGNLFYYVTIICLISLIICGIQMVRMKDVPTGRYRYEVTVGDYVRFTDIYEKYDVVERRGEIWVLEDKNE